MARERTVIGVVFLLFSQISLAQNEEERFCIKTTMTREEQVSKLFEQFWRWRLRNAPEFATSIGKHEYDDRLDEMSIASYKRRVDEANQFLSEIKSLETEFCGKESSKTTLLNLALLKDDIEQFLNGNVFKPYLFPINQLEGAQSDFPRLLSQMKKQNIDDFEKILSRLRQFPQQIDETIVLLREGLRLGLVMHNVSVEPVPTQILKIVEHTIEDQQIYKPFKEQPTVIPNEKWEEILTQAKRHINDVNNAYRKLAEFLRNDYLPKTRQEPGVSSLPKGQGYYAACLKFHTTTNLTPQQVHDRGLEEVARITKRMEEVKAVVNFSGTLKEFRAFLRSDPKFTFTSSEEIVSHYNEIANQISKKLPDYFSKLPKAKFVIEPVPAELAPSFPGAYYFAAPEDGSRPGTFYINTFMPETRKRYEAVSLSLHEAQPGHHTQAALTMESGSLVVFRRFMEDRKYYEPPARFGMNTGYIEGWGLYTEYLGEEMGMYTDPYDLFGRFSHEMLRACRLVVDTGIHALGWSRQKAIDYLLENTAADLHDITSEIDRYITWPGQACGYKIGEIKIKELRKKAEERLGEKFNLKEFHVLIASMGGVPLNILEDQIDEFIADSV